jgi:hypothetical protein
MLCLPISQRPRLALYSRRRRCSTGSV